MNWVENCLLNRANANNSFVATLLILRSKKNMNNNEIKSDYTLFAIKKYLFPVNYIS